MNIEELEHYKTRAMLEGKKADLIKRIVSKVFEVSKEDIEGKSRKREVCEARFVAMKILKDNSQFSLKKVGKMFGSRDYSTVIYAIDMVEDLNLTDLTFKDLYAESKELYEKYQNCIELEEPVINPS